MSKPSEQRTLVRKIMGLGEERVAELMEELLSNEAVSAAVGKAMTRTQKYKAMLDKNVAMALSLVNQPTRDDFDKLRKQVRNLQRELEDLREQIDPVLKAAAKRKSKAEAAE